MSVLMRKKVHTNIGVIEVSVRPVNSSGFDLHPRAVAYEYEAKFKELHTIIRVDAFQAEYHGGGDGFLEHIERDLMQRPARYAFEVVG
jgi:hypothetical protein